MVFTNNNINYSFAKILKKSLSVSNVKCVIIPIKRYALLIVFNIFNYKTIISLFVKKETCNKSKKDNTTMPL